MNKERYEMIEKTFLLKEKCYYTTLKYYPLSITIDNEEWHLNGLITCSLCEKSIGEYERIFVNGVFHRCNSVSSYARITCYMCYSQWETCFMSFIIFILNTLTLQHDDLTKRLSTQIYTLLKEKLVFNARRVEINNYQEDTLISMANRIIDDCDNHAFGHQDFIHNVNRFYDLLRRFPSYPLPSSISYDKGEFVIFEWKIDERKTIKLYMFHDNVKKRERACVIEYDPLLSLPKSKLFKYSSAWFNDHRSALNALENNPEWFKTCTISEKIDRNLSLWLKEENGNYQ